MRCEPGSCPFLCSSLTSKKVFPSVLHNWEISFQSISQYSFDWALDVGSLVLRDIWSGVSSSIMISLFQSFLISVVIAWFIYHGSSSDSGHKSRLLYTSADKLNLV